MVTLDEDRLAHPASEAADKPAAAHTPDLRRSRLGPALTGVYGAGALVDSVTSTALTTFLLFYLTAVCGLSNSLAGLSLFVGLVIDAVIDPLVGSLSDNAHTRLGRRHPFMLGSALPLALMLGALFSIPSGLTGWGLFACVTAVSIGLRVCHSLFNLPYVALGAELSDDYGERTRIVASRFLVSVVGGVACLLLGARVFMGGADGLLRRSAYAPFGWSCAAIVAAGGLVAGLGTLGLLGRLHRVERPTGSAVARLFRDLIEIFRNRSFVALFGSLLLVFIAQGVVAALSLHTYKFFWKLPATAIQMVLLAAPAGTLIGVLTSLAFSHRFEKRTVVMAGLSIYCVHLAVTPMLGIFHLLPSSGPVLDTVLTGSALVVSAFGGALGVAFQSALADAADEHEYRFGTRREGLFFAGLNFSSKAASGLGSLIAGLGLDLIRFPTNLAAHGGAQVQVGAQTAQGLALLYGPGPAIIVFLAVVVVSRYRLTRDAHERIQAELTARRGPRG